MVETNCIDCGRKLEANDISRCAECLNTGKTVSVSSHSGELLGTSKKMKVRFKR